MNTSQKKAFVRDVVEYMREKRVFDLVSLNQNNDVYEIVICNHGKIQKTADSLVFLEKDSFNFWQKVPFLKAPFRILDSNGIPYIDSEDFKNDESVKSWVEDSISEIVRHVVERLIKDSGVGKSFEYFLIKEVIAEVVNGDSCSDQQLLLKNLSECKNYVMLFHAVIKECLLDDVLSRCVSKLRDNVTLFEFTFTLPNKQKFLQYGQNWINILPSLAKAQTECLLLSQKGCFIDSCKDWVEDAGDITEWDKDIPFHLQSYIKHIPINSLRAIIGKNISHIVAILQLANIDPQTASPFFAYIGKSMNAMQINSNEYRIYADVVAQIYQHVEGSVQNGYSSILNACLSINLMQSLVAEHKNKGGYGSLEGSDALQSLKPYFASVIGDGFDKLVANEEVDYYRLSNQVGNNYVAVLGVPSDSKKFYLYENCVLLVGDTQNTQSENDDLEWWFLHLDDYRVLVSLVEGATIGDDLCNMYSNKNLSSNEIAAINGVIRNIQNKRSNKNTI